VSGGLDDCGSGRRIISGGGDSEPGIRSDVAAGWMWVNHDHVGPSGLRDPSG
jgi:hypothetical protein